MKPKYMVVLAALLFLIVVMGVKSQVAQTEPASDAGARNEASAPDAGSRSAGEHKRITELRDEFLLKTVVRAYLQKRTKGKSQAGEQERARAERTAGAHRGAGAADYDIPVLPVGKGGDSGSGARSCIDVACSMLGTLACANEDDVLDVARACAGNYSGDCLRMACRHVGNLECGSLSQIERLTLACSFNVSGACLHAGCDLVGSPGCEGVFDVTRILNGCAGNLDDACARDLCARSGKLACKTVFDFARIAQVCASTY